MRLSCCGCGCCGLGELLIGGLDDATGGVERTEPARLDVRTAGAAGLDDLIGGSCARVASCGGDDEMGEPNDPRLPALPPKRVVAGRTAEGRYSNEASSRAVVG